MKVLFDMYVPELRPSLLFLQKHQKARDHPGLLKNI
jgi:hypothetical protein